MHWALGLISSSVGVQIPAAGLLGRAKHSLGLAYAALADSWEDDSIGRSCPGMQRRDLVIRSGGLEGLYSAGNPFVTPDAVRRMPQDWMWEHWGQRG